MSGDWVIEGTQMPVESVLLEIRGGTGEAELRKVYGFLPEGVCAAAQTWEQHMTAIHQDCAVGYYRVLEFEPAVFVDGRHSGFAAVVQGEGDKPYPFAILATDSLVVQPRTPEQLLDRAKRLIGRWELKERLQTENLDWSAWRAMLDAAFPLVEATALVNGTD